MPEQYTPHTSTRYCRTAERQSEKPLPELYASREQCCGCTACESACPVKAIRMTPDAEGFLYPEVDAALCIGCGKCTKVCAFKPDQQKRAEGGKPDHEPAVYAVRHKDEAIRAASRSGGIFTALSDLFLSEGGAVYGCVLTEDFRAVHVRAEDAAGRDRMRGSKYIQSDLLDCFRQVQADLRAGKKVLFSGTSCQVAGLRSFLGKPDSNLFCVDIVCHGVPSPLVWRRYLAWQTEQHGSRVTAVDFRNKQRFGWRAHVETICFEDGTETDSQIFKTMFYSHSILRPCCYHCPYKSTLHPGDISIADYWGIEKAAPGFSDNKGVSLVLINTEAGQQCFDRVRDALACVQTKLQDSLQPPLIAPFPAPANRTAFWEDFYRMPFADIARKYGRKPFMQRVKAFLRKKLRRMLQKQK
jgi:coenzyme F420-reducing hydrogenase beta subunit